MSYIHFPFDNSSNNISRPQVVHKQGPIDYEELYDNAKKHPYNKTVSYTDYMFYDLGANGTLWPKMATPIVCAIETVNAYSDEGPAPFLYGAEILGIDCTTHVHADFEDFETVNNRQYTLPEMTIVVDWFLDMSSFIRPPQPVGQLNPPDGKTRWPALNQLYTNTIGVMGLPCYMDDNYVHRRFGHFVYTMGAIKGQKFDDGTNDSVIGQNLLPWLI